MAVNASYVFREAGGNLVRRNLGMTVAAVITMAVSLAALASVFIMRQAINQTAAQWKGNVRVIVFMEPGASAGQTRAVEQELKTTPGVKSFFYMNQSGAWHEFREMFAGNPTILDNTTEKEIPPSFRLVPTHAQDAAELASQFKGQPGVYRISYAGQEIKLLLAHFHTLQSIGLVLAIAVMVGAVVLIVSTIQLAIFARRREVAVMKLVGATNWFIRIPFMLEGLAHGVIGGAIAFGVAYVARNTIAQFAASNALISSQTLHVAPHNAVVTGIVVLVVGALIGTLGSAFAVRRFLAV